MNKMAHNRPRVERKALRMVVDTFCRAVASPDANEFEVLKANQVDGALFRAGARHPRRAVSPFRARREIVQ